MVLGRPKDSSLINYLVGGGRDIAWLSTENMYRAGMGYSTLSMGRVRGSRLIHYLVGGGRDITGRRYREGCSTLALDRSKGSSLINCLVGGEEMMGASSALESLGWNTEGGKITP